MGRITDFPVEPLTLKLICPYCVEGHKCRECNDTGVLVRKLDEDMTRTWYVIMTHMSCVLSLRLGEAVLFPDGIHPTKKESEEEDATKELLVGTNPINPKELYQRKRDHIMFYFITQGDVGEREKQKKVLDSLVGTVPWITGSSVSKNHVEREVLGDSKLPDNVDTFYIGLTPEGWLAFGAVVSMWSVGNGRLADSYNFRIARNKGDIDESDDSKEDGDE